MNEALKEYLFSLSIVLAAVPGLVKYKRMDQTFHPFVYYCCLAVVTETVVYMLGATGYKFLIGTVYNVFAIAEFCLLTQLFYNWGLFRRNTRSLYIILALVIVLFSGALLFRGLLKVNRMGKIITSLSIILFSITAFNKIVLTERTNILKNAKFWICAGCIIFFTYYLLVNTEQAVFPHDAMMNQALPDQQPVDSLQNNVWTIQVISNVFVNLIFAVAVLWIPRKKHIITLL